MRARASRARAPFLAAALALILAACTSTAARQGTGPSPGPATGSTSTSPTTSAAGSPVTASSSLGLPTSAAPSPSPSPNPTTTTTATATAPAQTSTEPTSPATVDPPAGIPVIALPQCRAQRLPTAEPGVLTIGTGSVPDRPWFRTDDPADGQGLDAAVAQAIAVSLGFTAAEIRWRTGVDVATVNDGEIDLYLDHLAVPDEPGSTVDFSTGYYDERTAILAGNGIAPGLTLKTLRTLTVGALTDTFAAAALQGNGVPGAVPIKDLSHGLAALADGSIDALALPLWRAELAVSSNTAVTVAGLLGTRSEQPPQLGAALPAGSELTPCVSAAIDALRAEGILDSMADQWIGRAPALG